jgi:aminopeptidase
MTEPYEQLLKSYAKLVVRVGVNVQLGQRVEIKALPEQAPVARAFAEEAYRVGASHVAIDYGDPHLQRFQVEHAEPENLGHVRRSDLECIHDWREDKPAIISLTGNPFPSLMDGLDPARLAQSQPIAKIAATLPIVSSNEVAWTIVGAPTPGWAASVGVSDVAELWDAVARAMRLDEDDPVKAWQEHLARLREREQILNDRKFDQIRYRGPGTDITLGISPLSRWMSVGSSVTTDGTPFVPNMPSEEVFFSPDWRRAEGFVRTTAPFFLNTMGAIVEGLELELQDGTIVGARAERGEEAVRSQLDSVPRAKHLGEVAIVDGASRVRDTGLVYKDMLFDENVGSHIAWGSGFPTGWEGGLQLTREQRIESGLNQANTHVDIVIGSPEVQIDGIAADGTVVPIVEGDRFILTDA